MKRIACTYQMTERSAVFECQDVNQYREDGLQMALYGRMTVGGRPAEAADIREALRADPDLKAQAFGGMYLCWSTTSAAEACACSRIFSTRPWPPTTPRWGTGSTWIRR